MTREEALKLLERNPRLRKPPELGDDLFDKLDKLYLFGKVSHEEDANVDWVEVWRAAGLIK